MLKRLILNNAKEKYNTVDDTELRAWLLRDRAYFKRLKVERKVNLSKVYIGLR